MRWRIIFALSVSLSLSRPSLALLADVESRAVRSEFVYDFLHLERGENGFDQDSRSDGSNGETEPLLSEVEYVIPQASFEVTLHLRQVEIRTRAASKKILGV